MITTYVKDGKYYFLDATSKYTKFGLPSSMIQGKEALIGIGNGEFKIQKVPVINRKENFKYDSATVIIDNNSVVGTGTLQIGGYFKIYNTYNLISSNQSTKESYVQGLVQRGNNKFFLKNYDLHNLDDKDRPITINYEYRVEDYFKKIGDEIYLNLNLNKSFFNDFIDIEKRKLPIENNYTYTKKFVNVLEVPENYEIDYLPDNSSFGNAFLGFSITYSKSGKKIIQRKTIYVDYLLLEPENFDQWNEVIHRINKAYQEVLVLKKV